MQRRRARHDSHTYASLLSLSLTLRHDQRLQLLPIPRHFYPSPPKNPISTLASHENADHQAEQRGDHTPNQPRLGPQRDGEDQTHEKREEIGPGRAPERLQLGELGEQGEQVHDHDGRERGVGDVDDDVREEVEAEDDQQRRDEVVERGSRLYASRIKKEKSTAVRGEGGTGERTGGGIAREKSAHCARGAQSHQLLIVVEGVVEATSKDLSERDGNGVAHNAWNQRERERKVQIMMAPGMILPRFLKSGMITGGRPNDEPHRK